MSFQRVLARFRVDKGQPFTHTSIGRPKCSYFVPPEENGSFLEKYVEALDAGEELHLTEKHRDVGPILIDLDFRFKIEDETDSPSSEDNAAPAHDDAAEELADLLGGLTVNAPPRTRGAGCPSSSSDAVPAPPPRKYTRGDIMSVLSIYYRELARYVNLATLDHRAYLMEKPSPRVEKGKVKDGVHIVFPGIVTTPHFQTMLRERTLRDMGEVFKRIGVENSAADCFDEAVISRNNWQMYGSSKPDHPSYEVTSVLDFETDGEGGGTVLEVDERMPERGALVELLSIRNKHEVAPFVSEDLRKEVEEWTKRTTRKANPLPTRGSNSDIFNASDATDVVHNHSKDVLLVEKLVDILNPSRTDAYDTWIRVGWCLRNIDYLLLAKWVEFSRKSAKFAEGECERLWDKMRVNGGLGIATLKMWAARDNPDRYREVIREDVFALIQKAHNGTNYDVACVVYAMYSDEFVCSSVRNKSWWQFIRHRWVPCEEGIMLSQKMSVQVCHEFVQVATTFNQRAAATSDDALQKQYIEMTQKLNRVALQLKNTSFKKNVLQECLAMFYVQRFEERLDSKPHLLGFENGVFDLESMTFREGLPDDYVTYTTGINYVPLNIDSPVLQEIRAYFSQVFPNEAVREYVQMHLASCLNGAIKEERFHIWTGCGANSKSMVVTLFEGVMNDYACKLPVSLLTNKRAASNAATSEIARIKGRRFAVLQEPSENEKFNVGIMKELSGGDKIQARSLYREPVEFLPQSKMVMTANHLPEVPATDDGTWRRIRVVEFISKFTATPDPTKKHQFPIDRDLAGKMLGWKETFMGLLIETYRRYRVTGLVEPEEVLKATKEYQKANDHINEFLETCAQPVENAWVSTTELSGIFKIWALDNAPDLRPNAKDLKAMVSRFWGKETRGRSGSLGWFGYRVSYNPYGGEEAEDV